MMKEMQDAVADILADDLPGMVTSYGAPLEDARVEKGFTDPFTQTRDLPAIYIYGVGRGTPVDEVGFLPVRMSAMLIQTQNPANAAEAGAVYGDLIADLLVDNVPEISGVFGIDELNVDTYFGPSEAKQKIVSVVTFTILAHYRRADR